MAPALRVAVALWVLSAVGLCGGCRSPELPQGAVTSAQAYAAASLDEGEWGCLCHVGQQLVWLSAEDSHRRRVIVPLLRDAHPSHVAISPDGTKLAWERSADALYITDLSTGETATVAELRPESAYKDVPMAWSPDGRFVAFSDGRDLYVGSDVIRPRRLTGDCDVSCVGWSPDGGKIAVGCHRDVDADGGVRVIDLETGGTWQVVLGCETAQMVAAVTWSPDGRFLGCMRASRHGTLEIVELAHPVKGRYRANGWAPVHWLPNDLVAVYCGASPYDKAAGIHLAAARRNWVPQIVVEGRAVHHDLHGDELLVLLRAVWESDGVRSRSMAAMVVTDLVEHPRTVWSRHIPGLQGLCLWRPDGGAFAVFARDSAGPGTLYTGAVGRDLEDGAPDVSSLLGWARCRPEAFSPTIRPPQMTAGLPLEMAATHQVGSAQASLSLLPPSPR